MSNYAVRSRLSILPPPRGVSQPEARGAPRFTKCKASAVGYAASIMLSEIAPHMEQNVSSVGDRITGNTGESAKVMETWDPVVRSHWYYTAKISCL